MVTGRASGLSTDTAFPGCGEAGTEPGSGAAPGLLGAIRGWKSL